MDIARSNKLVLSGCFIINSKRELLLLHRSDHGHYETPGGKVEFTDCLDVHYLCVDDFARTAERELYEELGTGFTCEKLSYFGVVEFTVPDGRLAIAHKFITHIVSGRPIINEPELFDGLDYLSIAQLDEYKLSPDLQLFLPKLKEM